MACKEGFVSGPAVAVCKGAAWEVVGAETFQPKCVSFSVLASSRGTHAILTGLKAGETVVQAGEVPKTL